MGTRTSHSKAAGCCWSRCKPHSSTPQVKGQVLIASVGPLMNRGSWTCQIPHPQLMTAVSLLIGSWGWDWAVVSGASSPGGRSPGRLGWRVGRKTCHLPAPGLLNDHHCLVAQQKAQLWWRKEMFFHLPSSSSFSLCQHLERRRNGCRAAFLSQTKEKKTNLSSHLLHEQENYSTIVKMSRNFYPFIKNAKAHFLMPNYMLG